MEWVLMTLGVCVVVVTAFWLVRRRSGEGHSRRPERPMHTGARSSKGVEDSMSMRMPTGGNSGA